MVKKQEYGWVYDPESMKAVKMSASIKEELQKKANDLVENILKPRYVKPPREDEQFNYIVDLSTKSHGHFFYFIATYCCPHPDAIAPSFEARFARLKHVGSGQFNIAYMRHTEQWAEILFKQTLDECIQTIRDDDSFMP